MPSVTGCAGVLPEWRGALYRGGQEVDMPVNVEELLHQLDREHKVCPMPGAWRGIYRQLPYRERTKDGWDPPLPYMKAAWWTVTDEEKRARFEVHLRWGDRYGVLDEVKKALDGLAEEEWYRQER